jgi:hypothetical protein
MVACGALPSVVVWLQSADFEVDPKANGGNPFVCHIVVAYSHDLYSKLQGLDAQGYFSEASSIERTYKDSVQVFKYDLIPGKNKLNQKIGLRSYIKAKGAFLFARYLTPGKFMENVGNARSLSVRFLPHNIEVHSDINLEGLLKKIGKE